jgi:hypothetical protein
MAKAPGHQLGQIIGVALEAAIGPYLAEIANEFDLYLDQAGPRPARPGSKVTWIDSLGNKHDLDYVFERGGTDSEIGVPVAFIESAWRRYTKHSRNKAQEIQGAILPLLATHSESKPFAGVVLAGVFTDGSLEQLRSNGFSVLYIPYEAVVQAFRQHGMDVEFTEDTPDEHLAKQVEIFSRFTASDREALGETLRNTAPDAFQRFTSDLRRVFGRRVRRIVILPLYGIREQFTDVATAIEHLRHHKLDPSAPLVKFAVSVRYSNEDRIDAEFADADDAVRFLETFT